VGLFWDKHTHVYLLTYLPRTHMGLLDNRRLTMSLPCYFTVIHVKPAVQLGLSRKFTFKEKPFKSTNEFRIWWRCSIFDYS